MNTELELVLDNRNGKTVISHCYFTNPLKLATPNANKKDQLQIVLMMASAGLLKGDSQHYKICCEKNTRTAISEQSYTKIFNTGDGAACKSIEIHVAQNASLYYLPNAVIPFEGSCFNGEISLNLAVDSELVYTDILAAGRIGMGEKFLFSSYKNRVLVKVDSRPVWLDNCFLVPSSMNLDNMLFWDGFTHQGVFYYYGNEEKQKRLLEYESSSSLFIAKTRAAAGICFRALGHSAQEIEDIFAELLKRVSA